MKSYGVNELRKMFLDFFESKDHLVMNSFSPAREKLSHSATVRKVSTCFRCMDLTLRFKGFPWNHHNIIALPFQSDL